MELRAVIDVVRPHSGNRLNRGQNLAQTFCHLSSDHWRSDCGKVLLLMSDALYRTTVTKQYEAFA